MVQKFSIQIDFYSKIITSVVIFSLMGVILASNFNIIVAVSILVTFIIALSFFPLKYELTANEVVIKKVLLSHKIAIKDITSVSPAKNIISYTFSSKGFFGYLGKTTDGTLSYSTDLKNNLLITCKDNKKILISPKQMSLFLSEVEKYRK